MEARTWKLPDPGGEFLAESSTATDAVVLTKEHPYPLRSLAGSIAALRTARPVWSFQPQVGRSTVQPKPTRKVKKHEETPRIRRSAVCSYCFCRRNPEPYRPMVRPQQHLRKRERSGVQ